MTSNEILPPENNKCECDDNYNFYYNINSVNLMIYLHIFLDSIHFANSRCIKWMLFVLKIIREYRLADSYYFMCGNKCKGVRLLQFLRIPNFSTASEVNCFTFMDNLLINWKKNTTPLPPRKPGHFLILGKFIFI